MKLELTETLLPAPGARPEKGTSALYPPRCGDYFFDGRQLLRFTVTQAEEDALTLRIRLVDRVFRITRDTPGEFDTRVSGARVAYVFRLIPQD